MYYYPKTHFFKELIAKLCVMCTIIVLLTNCNNQSQLESESSYNIQPDSLIYGMDLSQEEVQRIHVMETKINIDDAFVNAVICDVPDSLEKARQILKLNEAVFLDNDVVKSHLDYFIKREFYLAGRLNKYNETIKHFDFLLSLMREEGNAYLYFYCYRNRVKALIAWNNEKYKEAANLIKENVDLAYKRINPDQLKLLNQLAHYEMQDQEEALKIYGIIQTYISNLAIIDKNAAVDYMRDLFKKYPALVVYYEDIVNTIENASYDKLNV